MKYLIFSLATILGIPMTAWLALAKEEFRGLLISLLIFTTCTGDMTAINFISVEYYRGPDRGFEVTLTDLITWGLLIALLIKYPHKVKWLPYNSFCMGGYFAIATIATLIAPMPLYAGFTLFKLVKLYILYWTITNLMLTGLRKEYILYGLLAVGSYVTLLTLKQKYLLHVYRVNGPFDHSNTIPLYLNMIMPVVLLWGLSDRSLDKRLATFSTIISLGMVFSVAMTFSRAGTALSAITLIIALFLANFFTHSGQAKIVSLLVLLAVLGGGVKVADSFMDRIKNAPESSEAAREEFNEAAGMMVEDHLFGVGLNNFSYALTQTARYHDVLVVMANEEQGGVCHHIYKLTAAEMGYPGLVIFIILIIRFNWISLRYWWQARRTNIPNSLLLFGGFMGFFALHMSGFLEWAFRITPVIYLYILCAGIYVGTVEVLKREKFNSRSLNSPLILNEEK